MNLNYDLTEEQKEQFRIADEFGGSSAEIRKHPEWHSNFMNSFWNREKEGKAAGYYEIADYIMSHPSKKDMETGKIGADFNYLYALHQFMEKAEPVGISIPEIPLGDDGCVNTTQAKFILQDYAYQFIEHRQPLYTGRMPIDSDDNMEELKCLMCEGNEKAEAIYKQLESAARSEARVKESFGLPIGMTRDVQRRWNAQSAVLALDDMNIRGQQIVDAYEYAGESVETMLDLLDKRDAEMCGYVNQETAKRYLEVRADHYYDSDNYTLAKTGGASFAHEGTFDPDRDWRIDRTNARQLASAGITPIQIDYSTLDITEGIGAETGFKIIEAHGFEKYYDRTVKDTFGDDRQIAFFYNKHNGDIVEVEGAKKDNIVYAGVTLKTWRNSEDWYRGIHSSSGFNGDANLGYTEFTYHDGLFSSYSECKDIPVSKQTGRDKLGYQGIGDIPIPNYLSEFHRDSELPDKLRDLNNIDVFHSDNCYQLTWMMDMMLAAYDPAIKEDICPDYKRLQEDPYHCIMKERGGLGWKSDTQRSARQFQFAASWMHMPTEERQKYYDALVDIATERDERVINSAKESGRRVNKDDLSSAFVKKLSKTYLSDPKCPEDIYAIGVPKIEDFGFADSIPWLNDKLKSEIDVADFEAAVANISTHDEHLEQ